MAPPGTIPQTYGNTTNVYGNTSTNAYNNVPTNTYGNNTPTNTYGNNTPTYGNVPLPGQYYATAYSVTRNVAPPVVKAQANPLDGTFFLLFSFPFVHSSYSYVWKKVCCPCNY